MAPANMVAPRKRKSISAKPAHEKLPFDQDLAAGDQCTMRGFKGAQEWPTESTNDIEKIPETQIARSAMRTQQWAYNT